MTSWTALREGFDAFTRQLPVMLGVVLVLLVTRQIIDWIVPDTWIWVELLAQTVVLAPLYAGQYLIALKVVRREPVAFNELSAGFSQLGPIIGTYLLVTLLTVLATVAFIIPGIIVALMYSFVLIRFLDPTEGPRALNMSKALKESAEITRGYRGTLFGIGLLLGIPFVVLLVLQMLSLNNPRFPAWILEVATLLSGALFFGPVQAASYMVVYDHALKHPRG